MEQTCLSIGLVHALHSIGLLTVRRVFPLKSGKVDFAGDFASNIEDASFPS